MNTFKAIYYRLTAYVPRALPKSELEFNELKRVLNQYYGLEDHPQTWYTVSSQLLAGPPTSLRRSYGLIANATKKLSVIVLVQTQRDLAAKALNARLEEKAKETINAFREEDREQDLQYSSEIRPQWSDINPGSVSKSEPHHAELPSGAQHIQREVPIMPDHAEGMV